MKKSITFIVPCYNESERLHYAEKAFTEYFLNADIPSEVIFVNDGSTDCTGEKLVDIVHSINTAVSNPVASFISYKKNSGKGYALKKGINKASTDWVLTIDADMAAKPQEIISWRNGNCINLDTDHTIYIGSREKGISKHMVKSKFIRRNLGLTFNLFTQILTGLPFRDTQCGFKLYPTPLAKEIFQDLEDYGFAHDVEVLMKVKSKGINIKSLPLHWQHVSGSKVDMFKDSIKMLRTVVKVRRKYNAKA